MSETQVTVSLPSELNNLSLLAQSIVSDLAEGKAWMGVVGAALPIIFAEGAKIEDIKAELKSPKVWVVAGLLLGSIAAKYLGDKAAAAVAGSQPVP